MITQRTSSQMKFSSHFLDNYCQALIIHGQLHGERTLVRVALWPLSHQVLLRKNHRDKIGYMALVEKTFLLEKLIQRIF